MNDLEVIKHKLNILLASLAGARGTLKTMMELIKGRTKQLLEAISVVASMVQGINERLARIEGRIENSEMRQKWQSIAELTLTSLGLGKGALQTIGDEHVFVFPGAKGGYTYVQTVNDPETWSVYLGTEPVNSVNWRELRKWTDIYRDGSKFVPIRRMAQKFSSSVLISDGTGKFTILVPPRKEREYIIEVYYTPTNRQWNVLTVTPGGALPVMKSVMLTEQEDFAEMAILALLSRSER